MGACNYVRTVGIVLAFVLLGTDARGQKLRVEAYGDSLTAGFLSGTNVSRQPALKDVSKAVSDLAMYVITQRQDYLRPYHRPELAWPMALSRRLEKDGYQVSLTNVAVSGAVTWQIADQVKRVPATSEPTVAFFFIGHNDTCNNAQTPDGIAQSFVRDYEAAVREWNARHRDSTAYFLPLGRIDTVFDVLMDYVWYEGTAGRYRCQDSWEKFFPFCTAHYHLARQGKIKEVLLPKLRAMNLALEKAVEGWDRDIASSGNRLRFLNIGQDIVPKPEYFAMDCYHLSEIGQQAVATEVYNAGLF